MDRRYKGTWSAWLGLLSSLLLSQSRRQGGCWSFVHARGCSSWPQEWMWTAHTSWLCHPHIRHSINLGWGRRWVSMVNHGYMRGTPSNPWRHQCYLVKVTIPHMYQSSIKYKINNETKVRSMNSINTTNKPARKLVAYIHSAHRRRSSNIHHSIPTRLNHLASMTDPSGWWSVWITTSPPTPLTASPYGDMQIVFVGVSE